MDLFHIKVDTPVKFQKEISLQDMSISFLHSFILVFSFYSAGVSFLNYIEEKETKKESCKKR